MVQRFQEIAFGYAYSILHDFHCAQDACKEAFTEGYRDIGNLGESRAWPSWLRRVVFKHCHRLLRRKRWTTVELEMVTDVVSPDKPPDEMLIDAEMKTQLRVALETLTDEEATATIFRYLSGYCQRDIAELLDILLDTVKYRQRSARRKLNERMLAMTRDVLHKQSPSIHERFTKHSLVTQEGEDSGFITICQRKRAESHVL